MAPFLVALLIICVVALGIVVAFAWSPLRAGSRVLTPRGERVFGRLTGRSGFLRRAVWPRLRPVVRTVARPARAAKQRLEPVLEPVIRAVEEGSASRPQSETDRVIDLRDVALLSSTAAEERAPEDGDRLEYVIQPFRHRAGESLSRR